MCTRRGKDSVEIRVVQAVHHTNIYTACTRAIEGSRGYTLSSARARAGIGSERDPWIEPRLLQHFAPFYLPEIYLASIFARGASSSLPRQPPITLTYAAAYSQKSTLFFLAAVCYLSGHHFPPPLSPRAVFARAKAEFVLEVASSRVI